MPDFPEITSREDLTRTIRSFVLHWSAGNGRATTTNAYHYLISQGTPPQVNACVDVNSNAPHTRRFNSNSLGVSFAGQRGGTTAGGTDPLTEKQVRTGLAFVAQVLLEWGKHPLETTTSSYNSDHEFTQRYRSGSLRISSFGRQADRDRIRDIGQISRRHPILLHHAEVNHLAGIPQVRKVDITFLEFRQDLQDNNYGGGTNDSVFSDSAVDLTATGWERHHVSTGITGMQYHHNYEDETAVPTWSDIFGHDENGHWLRFETYWYYIRLQRGELMERIQPFLDNPAESIASGLRSIGRAISSPSSWMNRERIEEFRERWQAAAENASQYVEPELTDNWSVLEVRLQDAEGEPVEGAKVLFIYDEDKVYVAESEADGYARPGMIQHAPDTEIFVVVPEYQEDPNDPDLGAARRWSAQHHHWGPWPMPLSSERTDAIRDLSKADILDWDSVDDIEVTGEGLDADTVKYYMPTHGLMHVPIQARVPVIRLGAPYEEE